MPARQVLRMGDPRLLQPSQPVHSFASAELHGLIQDLKDTMHAERGAGLAAIQIGIPLRVVVFECPPDPEPGTAAVVPETVLINPSIERVSEKTDCAWEGCLSLPGLRGWVPRYTHIRYRGFDADGTPIDREARGFHARVVQHECDHLDGVLYPMRLADPSRFGFVDELAASGTLAEGALPCEDAREDL